VEALSRALERKRAYYNALFAEAKKRSAEVDATAFLAHLRERVAPILEALPSSSPEGLDRVLDALYRASLELFVRRLLGPSARRPELNGADVTTPVERVWLELLPKLPGLVALAPRRVTAALANAAYNLGQASSARPDEWFGRMLAVSEHCHDVETLFKAGQVAAWRSGLPHFRQGAIAAAKDLDLSLLGLLLGPISLPASTAAAANAMAASQTQALLTALEQRRFAGSGATPKLECVARLGGFSGFGGTFKRPPLLINSGKALLAVDAESTWEVHADAFGALLQRRSTGAQPATQRTTAHGFELSADGRVRFGELSAHFAELQGATSWVNDEELLVVAPARTHWLHVIAVTQGAPC
jgi:hypothetical protein